MSVFQRVLSGSSSCEDLLACVYQLNEVETRAYFALLENPRARVEEIADALDRDRSTANRAVQTLMALDLADRQTISMEAGGYYYVYRPTDPDVVRERIQERLEAFREAVDQKIDRFHREARERLPDPPSTDGQAATART